MGPPHPGCRKSKRGQRTESWQISTFNEKRRRFNEGGQERTAQEVENQSGGP